MLGFKGITFGQLNMVLGGTKNFVEIYDKEQNLINTCYSYNLDEWFSLVNKYKNYKVSYVGMSTKPDGLVPAILIQVKEI